MNDRTPHYISLNETSTTPTNIIVVDTEASIKYDGEKEVQTLRLGYCQLIRKREDRKDKWRISDFEFYTVEEFHKFLDEKIKSKMKMYIVAHNMSYDYTILKMDSYFSSRNYQINTFAIDNIFIISGKNKDDDKGLTCFDSMNFWRTSLAQLGEMLDNQKMKVDFTNVSDVELMTYCKNDVQILVNAIVFLFKFIQNNDLGNFKLTISSQAFTAFRHRFLTSNILVHNNHEILNMEIKSYRGGRTEAFFIGDLENVYKLDINSMYPFVMKNSPVPIKPLSKNIVTVKTVEELNDIDSYILADVNVNIKQPAFGVKYDNKLVFPIGKYNVTLTDREIRYLLENSDIGEILKINKVVFYEEDYIFKDYIDFFYNLKRDASNIVIRNMTKLFLNSLYGKFGQRNFDTPIMINDYNNVYNNMMNEIGENKLEEIFYGEGHHKMFYRLGQQIYEVNKSNDGLATNSVPIISSTITADARLYLWKLIKLAERDNVYYCDTDSLFVNENGLNNLSEYLDDDKLGYLKIEDFGNVKIYGVKDYVFNNHVKLKGIRQSDLKLEENVYQTKRFITKKQKYKNGVNDGIVEVVPLVKKLSREYNKGVVTEDGTVIPLQF